jgi:hypothetical protein
MEVKQSYRTVRHNCEPVSDSTLWDKCHFSAPSEIINIFMAFEYSGHTRCIAMSLFEPFEILRHSNQESCRKEKEHGESGRELRIWLPKNHGFQPPLQFQWCSQADWQRTSGGPLIGIPVELSVSNLWRR